jgi:hypothetical protein
MGKLAAFIFAIMLAGSHCGSVRGDEPSTGAKKLIQYGWDTPGTAFLRKHLKQFEASPFDGIVITVRAKPGDERLGGDTAKSLAWTAWQRRRFMPEDYQHAIEDLKAAKSQKLTDNFIAVISQPGAGFDWFDDAAWADVLHNITIMTRIARAGACAGLMFDPEEYAGPMWSYARMPDGVRAKHGYDEYAGKVRQRGREFIKAVNGEFPGVTILTLFGPFLYAQNVNRVGAAKTAEASYNLLGPFYDGIIEAADDATTLVDGYEQSYGETDEDEFTGGRRNITVEARAHSKVPERFDKHVKVGFGLWIDNQSLRRTGWFPDEPAKNHFTPAQWQASVHYALKHTDKYVWVYNERARWWDGRPGEAYEKATVAGRTAPVTAAAK